MSKEISYWDKLQAVYTGDFDILRKIKQNGEKIPFRLPYSLNTLKTLIEEFDFNIHGRSERDGFDVSGQSLLHFAISDLRMEFIEYLIGEGIDVNMEDDSGRTPIMLLDLFIDEDNEDYKLTYQIFDLLKSTNVDLLAINNSGYDILDIAVNKNNIITLDMIKRIYNPISLYKERLSSFTVIHMKSLYSLLDESHKEEEQDIIVPLDSYYNFKSYVLKDLEDLQRQIDIIDN